MRRPEKLFKDFPHSSSALPGATNSDLLFTLHRIPAGDYNDVHLSPPPPPLPPSATTTTKIHRWEYSPPHHVWHKLQTLLKCFTFDTSGLFLHQLSFDSPFKLWTSVPKEWVVAGEHSKCLYNCAYEILDQQKRQKYMTSFIQRRQLKYINFRNKQQQTNKNKKQKRTRTHTHTLSRGRHAGRYTHKIIRNYIYMLRWRILNDRY